MKFELQNRTKRNVLSKAMGALGDQPDATPAAAR